MGTEPRTISKADALAEAYKRGLLPPDKKAAYEEAQKRGLVGAQPAQAAPARGGGFDMAPSSPAARRDMLTPAPAPKPMAAAPGAQYSFTPTPEMQASAPIRAAIAENDQQQRAAGRIPLVTDRGGGYVADPGTQMADMATAQRMERERQERREAAAVNMGDLPLSTDAGGNIRPGSAVDEDISKGIITSPVRLANAAVGAGESMVNLPGDVANAYLAGIYERGGGDKPQVPRLDAPRIPLPAELESMTGQLTEGLAQFLIARRAVGKVAPGGNLAANLGKDAIAVGVGFDGSTGRVADMIDPSAIPEGPLRDYANWLRTQPEDSPLVGRLKNLIEDFTLSGPMLVPQPIVRGAQAVGNALNPSAVPTNAGGAGVQAARQARPQPAPAPTQAAAQAQPQPSVAPVSQSPIPQAPPGTAQAGTPGAGQQVPGGPATLQGVQTTPPVSKQQALIDRDTIKITRRIMRSAGIKDADVMGYLPGAVQRFESLNDPRIPLAFFLKSDLPKHFPEEVANRVSTNLDVWGRARNAETGVNDTSRATINKTVSELRKTQQDFLTQSAERNLFKGSLIGQEDQIVASLRETGRKGYEPVLDNARQIVDGRRVPTPDEAAAVDEIRGILSDPMMLGYVDDATRIRAKKEGVDLDQMLKDDPIGSAHWLQSEFRRLSDAAEDAVTGKPTRMSQAYDDLRDMVLDPLKRAAPGYEGAMNRYGHLYGAKDAVRFGKGIFTVGRSAYDTAQKVRQFRKLGRRQQTVAWKSIRDEFLNEFRGTPEDAAAKVTRMQSEGALDILEQLGPRGKRFADDIRSIAQVENPNLRAIDQGSGSPTYANQQGGSNAVDMVQSPVNQAIGAFGQKGSLPTTLAGDAVLAFSGLPPVLTLGKGVTWTIDRFGNPSKKVLARATEGLYGLPKGNALTAPAKPKRVGGPKSPAAAALEAEEAEDMAELLRALDQTEKNPKTRGGRKGQAILNKIDAAAKSPANALNAPPKPPSKKGPKPPPGTTSMASPTGTGIVAGGIGGAMLDQEDPGRGFLIGAAGLGTAAGLGNKLSKLGSGPKAPPKVGGAAKVAPPVRAKTPPTSSREAISGAQKRGNIGKPLDPNADYGSATRFYFGEPDFPYYRNSGSRESDVLRREQASEWTLEEVKLKDLTGGGQEYVNPGFREVPKDGGFEGKPPVVVRERGRLIIHNGNHRLVAAAERGDETIVAGVIDLDQQAPALAPPKVRGGAKASADELRISESINEMRSRGVSDANISSRLALAGVNIPPDRIDYFAKLTPATGSGKFKGNVVKLGPKAAAPPKVRAPAGGKGAPPAKPESMGMGGGSRSLPMDEGSRMQRAREMGFDVDTPLYHGTTNEFDEFGGPTWLAREREYTDAFSWATKDEIANGVASPNVVEAYVRGRLKTIDDKAIEQLGYHPDQIDALKRQGYDGVQSSDQVLIFDPANIRRTDATFDPSQEGSSKLLAGFGRELGAGGAAGLVTAAAGPRDSNGDGVIDDNERAAHGLSVISNTAIVDGVTRFGRRMLGNKLKGPPRAQKPPPTADEWAARIQKDQDELQRLLTQYNQIDRADPNVDDLMRANLAKQRNAVRRIAEKTKKMDAARQASAPATQTVPPAPMGPPKSNVKPPPGTTSQAHPAITSGLVTGGAAGGLTYAVTGDEDLAMKVGIGAGIGGGVLGNALSKSLGRGKGGAPKPPPGAAKAPKPTPEPFTPSGPIKVYHSSPHDFDGFSMSKIGTGEGNQTYGHGIYFAENPGVTSSYDKSLGGKTYAAEIDVKPGELIDFDAPLEKQPRVAAAIQELAPTPEVAARLREMPYWQDQLEVVRKTNGWTRDQLAEALRGKGFKGIAYLDLGSRQAGKGTRNFVIFDEGAVKMTANPYKAPPAAPKPPPVSNGGNQLNSPPAAPKPPQSLRGARPQEIEAKIPITRITTPRGKLTVTATVFKNESGALVLSPEWPFDARWVKQNPESARMVEDAVLDNFERTMRNNKSDVYDLALVDGYNNKRILSAIQNMKRPDQIVIRTKDGGDIAVVSRDYLAKNPGQYPSPQWEMPFDQRPRRSSLPPGNYSVKKVAGETGMDYYSVFDDAGYRVSGEDWFNGKSAAYDWLDDATGRKNKRPTPLRDAAGRAAVGVMIGSALGLSGDAEANDDLTGKISETEQSIAAINKALADFDKITDPFEKQRMLKAAGFYSGRIDGNIAGQTTEGIKQWRAQKAAELEKAEGALTDLVRRDAYQRNNPNPIMQGIREYGPIVALGVALYGSKFFRGRAGKQSGAQAAAKSAQLNQRITKVPKGGLTSLITKEDTSRPANLNTLWQEGGASKDQLPFKQDAYGNWKPNPKAKPVEELFPNDTPWQTITKYIKGKDLTIIMASGFESVAVQPFIDKAESDLRDAEQEWKDNPSDETFKRVEDAKNALLAYQTAQRIGWGIAGGRVLGSIGAGYAKPRPNIPMAATEQAGIKQYIAANKPPPKPRSPRPPGSPSP